MDDEYTITISRELLETLMTALLAALGITSGLMGKRFRLAINELTEMTGVQVEDIA